jgi:hypothetical protein
MTIKPVAGDEFIFMQGRICAEPSPLRVRLQYNTEVV